MMKPIIENVVCISYTTLPMEGLRGILLRNGAVGPSVRLSVRLVSAQEYRTKFVATSDLE